MANNVVRVIAMQHQHVYTLLNKIKELEKQLTECLLEQDDWYKFIAAHIDEINLKYVTKDLTYNWYDREHYNHYMSYNFYRGKEIYSENTTIKYVDITIGITKKQVDYFKNENNVPVILNLVTTPIDITEIDNFLNREK